MLAINEQKSTEQYISVNPGSSHLTSVSIFCIQKIGHSNNIPTMQFFTGISRNTQSKSYMLSLTECDWEFRDNALWDTH